MFNYCFGLENLMKYAQLDKQNIKQKLADPNEDVLL